MSTDPSEDTWTGRARRPLAGETPVEKELERLKAVVYWNRIKANILTVLLAWLMFEVYDVWPDQDFDAGHVETFRHFVRDNAQVTIAFLGLLTVVFTNLMQTVWARKK